MMNKTPYSQYRDTNAKDHNERRDTNTKDNTARDTDGNDTYPLVKPRPEEAPNNDDGTLEQITGTEGSSERTCDMMNNTLDSQTQYAKDHNERRDTNTKDNTARDTNGDDTYTLVDPRPEEAPDNDDGTLEQSTGTKGSTERTCDMMNKTLYSQHRDINASDHNERSAKTRTGRTNETTEEDTDGGYSDPLKTPTGQLAMTSMKTWTLYNAKTPTEVQRAKDYLTGTLDARDHNEGDDGANTSDICTKPLRKSNYQRSRSTLFQRSGTERQRAKEDGETHTEETKTLTGARDSPKALSGEHARDRDKEDANDPRWDTQHAKAINIEDINAKNHNERSAKTRAGRAKETTEEDTDGGYSDPLKTPTGEPAMDPAKRQDRDHNERRAKTYDGQAKSGQAKSDMETQRAKEDAENHTGVPKTRAKTYVGQAKSGMETQRAKEDAENRTWVPKTHTNSDTKTPTGTRSKSHAERQDKDHNKRSGGGYTYPWVEHRPDGSTRTPNEDLKTRAGKLHGGKDKGTTRMIDVWDHKPGPLFPGTKAPAVPGHEKSARPF